MEEKFVKISFEDIKRLESCKRHLMSGGGNEGFVETIDKILNQAQTKQEKITVLEVYKGVPIEQIDDRLIIRNGEMYQFRDLVEKEFCIKALKNTIDSFQKCTNKDAKISYTNFEKYKENITIEDVVSIIQSKTVRECRMLIRECKGDRYTCGECIKQWLESEVRDE